MAYFMTALAMALSVCLLMQIISLRKNASLAGRFLRQSLTAALAVSLSLMIVLILNITEPDDAAVLAPMSTIIFGGAALLIAINLTMVSICGYKSTRDSIKMISNMAQENRLVFVRVSILKDIFLVIGKGVISIISYSFFMFANALYSTGMGGGSFCRDQNVCAGQKTANKELSACRHHYFALQHLLRTVFGTFVFQWFHRVIYHVYSSCYRILHIY